MPLPKVTINNVSMDYFLHGVEATKPQGAQPVQSQVNGGTGAVEAQKTQSAGKMVAQLDVLLMKAAKASTKSLDGRTVKTTLKKLVDDGVLSNDSLKLLAKTADKATKTLKALFAEGGVPCAERGAVPVVRGASGPLLVYGLVLDERAAPQPGDTVWRLTFSKLETGV